MYHVFSTKLTQVAKTYAKQFFYQIFIDFTYVLDDLGSQKQDKIIVFDQKIVFTLVFKCILRKNIKKHTEHILGNGVQIPWEI